MAVSAVASPVSAAASALSSQPRHGHKPSLADVDAQGSSVAPAKNTAGHVGQTIDRTV
jgi:hypothetical protein